MQVERVREQSLASGERVSNAWVICLQPGDNGWKRSLIPNVIGVRHRTFIKVGDLERGLAVREKPMEYQLVGEVMAHQGKDA